MEIRVLGAVEITGADGPVPIGASKQRQLLAALLISAGQTCPSDRLIDAIWGELPPRSARKLLQLYISQLRKVLPAPARIHTRGSGYTLEAEDECLDAARFERLLAAGRAASREGNPALAVSLFERGLGLWRGQAYGEFAYHQFARAEANRLEELRLVGLEEHLEAGLALGRHRELLPELRSLAASQPLRERLQAQAMLALYRSGRQSEALELYRAADARLRDELGLEPGLELRELQRRILQHDRALLLVACSQPAVASLPAPPNRLLGRERELRELNELLGRDDVRLLVLSGAGGSGKTRLALEAARATAARFANGAVFVALAPLRDPGLVIAAIAHACGLKQSDGEKPLSTLSAALRSRELLLVLDNFEHVRAAAPSLVELLAAAPRLTVLVTSRAVLHLSGEHVYPVEPLAIDAASELFSARARESDPGFDPDRDSHQAIGQICSRLDGLPLAIELAAGCVRTLTPVELLARLEPRLPLLTGGPQDLPARQLTMRATIEWSFELLNPEQRRDLSCLAVFAGGFSLAAVEAVCGLTLQRLSALLDHNLVRRSTTSASSRYAMLETIREYAAGQLRASGEADQIARNHLQFMLELAEPANLTAEAEGPQDFDAVLPEHENARGAIEWALASGEVELGLRLAVALESFWVTHNPFEGMELFGRLLGAGASGSPALRARALRAAAGSAQLAGQPEQAQQLYRQSLATFRTLGDEQGIAILTYRLGYVALALDEPERARPLLEQSLNTFIALGSSRGQAQTIGTLGALARAEGDTELAGALYQQSATLSAKIGRKWWQARMLANLAELAVERDRSEEAAARARQALGLARQIGDRLNVVFALACLAWAAAAEHDARRAGRLWGAVEAEEARAPLGTWGSARQPYAARVLTLAEPDLHPALNEGRQLSLDQAVDYALDGETPTDRTPASSASSPA